MVPIDIISGFLGAGKTTFANRLLRHYMDIGRRPVYIVNEFGQTGLDADLITSNGFEAVEMAGGCVCCTLKDDVALTIKEVIRAFSPTHIVFEPSGVFVFETFIDIIRSDLLRPDCEIGHVFTMVDSVKFERSKAVYGSFIYNQIKNAQILIISKLEKINHNIDEMICDLRKINPHARIMSQPWDEWTPEQLASLLKAPPVPDKAGRRALRRHRRLKTVTVTNPKSLTWPEMHRLIEHCKNGRWGDIYRVKGLIRVEGRPMLLNISLDDAVITPCNGSGDPSVTFIGNSMDADSIEHFFMAS